MHVTPLPNRVPVALLVPLALVGLVAAAAGLTLLGPEHWFNLDIRVYFNESRWAVGDGTLYGDVPSEYPLLANLLFAGCRVLSACWQPLGPGLPSYALLWVCASWLVYLAVAHAVFTRLGWKALVLWLAPAVPFLALLRFDLYPTATTWLALLALREGRTARGAFWLGVTVALKGYALFALPAFLVYVLADRGRRAALTATALAVAPFAVSNLVVLGYAGLDGMLSPFQFHARRLNYGESSFDAIYYAAPFLFAGTPVFSGLVPGLLQAGCALAAAALRPRTFEELVRALLFALLGFMSFSVFYSPQYCLWVLPLVCFVRGRAVWLLTLAFGWVTFAYYPIFHVLKAHELTLATAAVGAARLVLFRCCVVALTLIRLAMMACALRPAPRRRAELAPDGEAFSDASQKRFCEERFCEASLTVAP